MSTRLGRVVPAARDEPGISLMSRLAARNGIDLPRFGSHMGLSPYKVLNGDQHELERLSTLAGIGTEAVLASSVRKVGAGRFHLHGQELTIPVLRRRRPWLCPMCARADVRDSGLTPAEAVHCRAVWAIEQLRTCAVHGVVLLDVPSGPLGLGAYDQAAVFRSVFENLEDHCLTARIRRPSDLEEYLLRRLERGCGGVDWLDGLHFHVVATFVERVGAVATFGRMVRFSRLTSDDWWAAGVAGFAIVERGHQGVFEFLDELQAMYEYRRSGSEGAHAVYGALYSWLVESGKGEGFLPVRDLVLRRLLRRFPVTSGTQVFGTIVKARTLHSIKSASLEYGRHPVRLRRLLAAEGLLPPDHAGRPDAYVTFDAEAARPFLERVSSVMTKSEVGGTVGLRSVDPLIRGGVLTPMARPVGKRAGQVEFQREDVIRLMSDLTRSAVDSAGSYPDYVDLRTAARRTFRPLGEVVRMIIAGEWPWAGKRGDVRGFGSFRVRAKDLPQMSRSADLDGLLVHQAAKLLKTNNKTVRNLVRHGILPTHREMTPYRRIFVNYIKIVDLETFASRYVSLHGLSRERDIHPLRLKAILDDEGISPTMTSEVYGATFYLRSALA